MISYYELLGMIKDKTNPKKVKFEEKIFEWNSMNYYCDDIGDYLNGYMHEIDSFEKNIEIIEENKKIETISSYVSGCGSIDENNLDQYINKLFSQQSVIFNKLNEVIREVNKLRKECI